jgi:hypothetical protein
MSAILKPEPLETIFDHGVTDMEMAQLFGGYPEPRDEYLDGLGYDSLQVDIVRLYRLRGQPDIADKHIHAITDPAIRTELSTRACAVHS